MILSKFFGLPAGFVRRFAAFFSPKDAFARKHAPRMFEASFRARGLAGTSARARTRIASHEAVASPCRALASPRSRRTLERRAGDARREPAVSVIKSAFVKRVFVFVSNAKRRVGTTGGA
jgi:hypothetical protein